tara:strand:- start:65 stop:280 length:216 start_codon:yes stop_codon:yes gene_type:complete
MNYLEPDTRFYFWTTLDGVKVELEVDITIVPVNAMLPCVVMSGPRRGEEVMRRAMAILSLYDEVTKEESSK